MIIRAAASPGEVRVAVTDATGLRDYALWRPGAPDGVGSLHRGRVTARMPQMAGSFVRLADADGFLPDSECPAPPQEGQILGVRVTRAAQGGKGPRLSAKLDPAEAALTGNGLPALLRTGPNAVLRMAALYPDAPVVCDANAVLAELRPTLGARATFVPRAFDDDTESAVSALAEATGALPGGARFSVHPTPALTAIDIDLAAASAGRGAKGHSQEAANRALIGALARQIRLRNLAGAILIDFAGLPVKRRAALGPALAAALAEDNLQPRFLGFSALGLAEILRPRIHPPLHEMLTGPHAAGLAALRQLAAIAATPPHRLPQLAAAPAVAEALARDAAALDDLANRAGRPLMLRPDPALAPWGWRLEA